MRNTLIGTLILVAALAACFVAIVVLDILMLAVGLVAAAIL